MANDKETLEGQHFIQELENKDSKIDFENLLLEEVRLSYDLDDRQETYTVECLYSTKFYEEEVAYFECEIIFDEADSVYESKLISINEIVSDSRFEDNPIVEKIMGKITDLVIKEIPTGTFQELYDSENEDDDE